MKGLGKFARSLAAGAATLAIGLPFGVSPSACADVDTSGKLTAVMAGDHDPLYRGEMFISGLSWNSDIYGVGETYGGKDFYKVRAQALPVKAGDVRLGPVIQRVDGHNSPPRNDMGIALKITGRPTKNSRGFLEVRVFPESDTFDAFGKVTSGKWLGDLLVNYNSETGRYSFRPGIESQVSHQYSLGLEAKYNGGPGGGDWDYLGVRLTGKF